VLNDIFLLVKIFVCIICYGRNSVLAGHAVV